MDAEDRIRREQQFHDARILENDAARRAAEKYYVLMEYPRTLYIQRVRELGNGRQLLEYGCSDGESSRAWAAGGAFVTGIDISPEAIRTARERAQSIGRDIRYEVMNAEAMTFVDASFDVVVGTGILHHLVIDRAFAEITRVLRHDGHALFIEPLGHNPLINLYRRFTPAMRSEDEHPLRGKDLRRAASHFSHVRIRYFNLLALAAVPLQSTPVFRPALAVLRQCDRLLFSLLPFTRRYAWMALIECANPLPAAASPPDQRAVR
jgi:SAM-dependent methyltransferase